MNTVDGMDRQTSNCLNTTRLVSQLPYEQLLAWLRLVRDRSWSLRQKHALLNRFGCPTVIYQHPTAELAEVVPGVPNTKFATQGDKLALQIEQDLHWLEQTDCHLLDVSHSCYPEMLKNIYDPPIALFARGNLQCLSLPKVAIVGSRRPTPVGGKIASQLAYNLAELGIVVTSGMALGIDGISHQGALDAQTPTVAVWGCGLDIIYPSRHRRLSEDIQANGCVVSEYPLGYAPTKYSFPQRNRIVSGISLGVIIIEAAERSGTLVTARLALEQNRELMVVPGSALSAQYAGSHRLIQQGAAIVTNIQDVLATLWLDFKGLEYKGQESDRTIESEEKLSEPLKRGDELNLPGGVIGPKQNPIMRYLGAEPSTVDQIILASQLTAREVSSMLLMLEIEGLVKKSDSGGYVSLV